MDPDRKKSTQYITDCILRNSCVMTVFRETFKNNLYVKSTLNFYYEIYFFLIYIFIYIIKQNIVILTLYSINIYFGQICTRVRANLNYLALIWRACNIDTHNIHLSTKWVTVTAIIIDNICCKLNITHIGIYIKSIIVTVFNTYTKCYVYISIMCIKRSKTKWTATLKDGLI